MVTTEPMNSLCGYLFLFTEILHVACIIFSEAVGADSIITKSDLGMKQQKLSQENQEYSEPSLGTRETICIGAIYEDVPKFILLNIYGMLLV